MGLITEDIHIKAANGHDLISVITPCFNAARTLRRAHRSLLMQDCRWEHIIVDDGSTDDSAPVIQELAGDSRVVSVRSLECRGAGAALNAGLRLAQGDLIAFLDADDEYLAGHLSSHLQAMNRQPVDLFWGGVEVVAEREEDTMVPDVGAGFGLISVHDCVVQGTIFGRRRVFEQVRFSEDRGVWWQDYDFIRRAGQHFRVEKFEQPTYRYYRNSGGSLVDRAKAAWPAGPDGSSGQVPG